MPALEEVGGTCDKYQISARKDDKKEIGAAYVMSGREVGRGGAWLTPFGSCELPVMLNCPVWSHCNICLLTD